MIEPVLKDDTLLADIMAARQDPEYFHLWWLGQSGYLIQWSGRHLLLDPYLSDSLTRKYADTTIPHVRMTERAVAPERLDFIDVVTSSHNHTDHLDGETLGPLLRVNPAMALVIPEANRQFVADHLQIDPGQPLGMEDGTRQTVAGFEFIGVPSAHEALERDDQGRDKFLGYIVRFGDWTIYHGGDTVRYDGMAQRLRAWSIDVALLPINGTDPSRGVPGNLTGPEAAQLAHDIHARLVVPGHYEMFKFNTASSDSFLSTARGLGQPVRLLRCGEHWSSAELNQLERD